MQQNEVFMRHELVPPAPTNRLTWAELPFLNAPVSRTAPLEWPEGPTTVRVLVPELPPLQRRVIVEVDSAHMHPRLREGDWLHCQAIPREAWPYMPAGIYVLETREQFLIRRVIDNDLGRHQLLRLHADNPQVERESTVSQTHLDNVWQVLEIVSGTVR